MNINLDDFFGPKSSYEPSIASSKNNSMNIFKTSQSFSQDIGEDKRFSLLKLNDNIFDAQSPEDENFYYQVMEKSQNSMKSYSSRLPGERLFYQSQAIEMRRRKQLEQKEEQELQKLEGLFIPQINKKSKNLKSHYVIDQYNPCELKKQQIREQQYQIYCMKKNKQQAQQCTFKPEINSKTKQLTKNRSTPAFESLYHTSKTQQIKKQLRILQAQKALKFQSKPKEQADKAFQNFLSRNQDFKNKQKSKLQLLDCQYSSYDNDGQKLFTPKITPKKTPNNNKIFNKHSSPSLRDLNEMLLQRMRKMPQSQLFKEFQEAQEDKETD